MERTTVYSSVIASIGYDKITRILEIEFVHGKIYRYFNVPETVFTGLMDSSSQGSYFDDHIKKGGYRYQQVS